METKKAIIGYLEAHWSHIVAAGAVIIAHGGIKTVALQLWNGNPKPQQPASTEAVKNETKP